MLAAIFTQGLGWLRDFWRERRDGKFAALYIATALEAYARTCATLVSESETYDRSDQNAGKPHGNIVDMPEYPDVEWKAFGIKDSEKAMAFRTKIDSDRSMFTGLWEHLDEDDIVPEVREKAAQHGLTALGMASTLRAKHNLLPLDDFGEFTTEGYLTEKRDEYVARRVKEEERRRKDRLEDPLAL
ncbi:MULTISPECIES: hypothetical protein [unclassified Phenylobacterium]|uniref:hypothetical protein n=1 Tax=unclassified Phenylobacterium TaxID=2640670 RepID=UPI003F50B967